MSGPNTLSPPEPPEVDGNGGWWCCFQCGSIAQETFIDGACVRCGGTKEHFYRDGDWK